MPTCHFTFLIDIGPMFKKFKNFYLMFLGCINPILKIFKKIINGSTDLSARVFFMMFEMIDVQCFGISQIIFSETNDSIGMFLNCLESFGVP